LDRDFLGGSVFDRREPEGAPGPLLELAADQLEGATDHAAIGSLLAGVVLRGWSGRGELREPDLGIRPARSPRFPSRLAEMIAHFIPRDRPEPAAERVALPLLAEARDMRRHRLEDVLEDVRDLLLGEIPVPAPLVHHR